MHGHQQLCSLCSLSMLASCKMFNFIAFFHLSNISFTSGSDSNIKYHETYFLISPVIRSTTLMTSIWDPIPSSLLKQFASVHLPTITRIINLFLSTSTFPDQFKSGSVHPYLKKSILYKENLTNYHPISHLTFSFKLTERVGKCRLTEYL